MHAAQTLIAAATAYAVDAVADHPHGAREIDCVDFITDRLLDDDTISDAAWHWANTESFRATLLGIVDAVRGLS